MGAYEPVSRYSLNLSVSSPWISQSPEQGDKLCFTRHLVLGTL
jgi:hypothetical protein